MSVLAGVLLRGNERAPLAAYFRAAGFYGPVVVGPSSLLTLMTGLAMAFISRAFTALWVQIGFAGIVLHFILGAGLIRIAALRVQRLVQEGPDPVLLGAAARRLRVLNAIYLLMLFLVVGVMVLKPV